jgi:DNA-directed RNA polymerase specialized sigma24 family protein
VRLLSTQSDERLALLARHGHDFAFEELVRRYRDPLTRYLRRLLGDPVASADVLERGLIRAWASLLGGTTPIDVRSWLYGSVHAAAVGKLARYSAADLTQRQRDALSLRVRGYEPEEAVSSLGLQEGLLPAVADRMRAAARGAATALVPSRAVLAAAALRA